jgi:hypothetical protein
MVGKNRLGMPYIFQHLLRLVYKNLEDIANKILFHLLLDIVRAYSHYNTKHSGLMLELYQQHIYHNRFLRQVGTVPEDIQCIFLI